MSRYNSVLAALLCGTLSLSFPHALGAEAVKIGVTGGVEFIPYWAGKERGTFRKYGLDVDIVTIQAGTIAVQALLGGSIEFAGLGQAYLRGAVRGADMVMVATYMDHFPYSIMVKPSITKPEHLKGSRFAISRFGSAAEFAARIGLQHLGIKPDKDLAFVQVGNETARFSALQAGTVDATIFGAPLVGVARRLGFNTLYRMRDLPVFYPHEGLVVTRRYAAANRDTVSRFVKVLVESIHELKIDKEFAIAQMAKYLKINPVENRAVLEDSYQEIVIEDFIKNPRPTLEGIKFLLEVLRDTEKIKMSMDPRDYVDMAFMEQLNKSGFVESLYKRDSIK
jgi:NitT/TauT family transport system substrate-binding protein